MVDNSRARQNTNKENALALAKIGVAVFPSSGKTPLIPLYNRLDTEITPEDREASIQKYKEDHDDKLPIHVGATKDPEVVKRMFRAFRDAVPSIATGPSGLVVLDADAKDEGPAKMHALFDENGGLPEGCRASPTKSGGRHFIFADPDRTFTNKAGLLKKNYGTDVRGSGGQIVAPGSMLEDGRSYGSRDDLVQFMRAYVNKAFPPVPGFVTDLIGSAPDAATDENVTPSRERDVIQTLIDNDWPEFEETFDPTLGKYDLEALIAENTEFAALYKEPSADCSTNRFLAARHVMREWPSMPVEDLAVFFEQWEGSGAFTSEKPKSGEYDLRQVAREWLKNQGLSKPSSGDAFGAVVDDEEDEEERALAEYDKKIEAERKAEREQDKAAAAKKGQLYLGNTLIEFFQSPDWIVENMLAPRTVGAISGASNVGKSFSVIDLAQHLPRGRKWFGLNVDQCGVMYAYGEGHLGIASRIYAWAQLNDTSGGDIVVRDGIPNFALDPKGAVKAIKKAVAEANKLLAEKGLPLIRVLILDTFAKATSGAEENSAKDMGPIMNALRDIADSLDLCVVIVHHTGKDSSLGLRGSTAILGDVDFNVEIIDTETGKKHKPAITVPAGQLCMYVAKMRDAPKGGKFYFKLEPLEIGKNKWGNPVTSMVLRPIIASEGAAMGAVVDDEPGTLSDELTPANNEKGYEARIAFCQKVRAAVQSLGKLNGDVVYADALAVEEAVSAIRKIRRESGDNFARDLRKALFGSTDSRTLLPEGYLDYKTARGKDKASQFVFTPRR